MTEFHVGDVITSLVKTALIPGGRENVLYTTLGGAIGVFAPFITKEEGEFYQLLEMKMKQEYPSILGRDHTSFRGYYSPVKSVVDGDMCQFFSRLAPEKRREVAGEFDRSASDILKKLEDISARSSI